VVATTKKTKIEKMKKEMHPRISVMNYHKNIPKKTFVSHHGEADDKMKHLYGVTSLNPKPVSDTCIFSEYESNNSLQLKDCGATEEMKH